MKSIRGSITGTQRTLSLLLTFIIVLLIIASSVLTVSAEDIIGSCGADGTNIKWKFNTETGELLIKGSGKMKDYLGSNVPWYTYRKDISSVVFSGDIENIGSYAFASCPFLTSVDIPQSVTEIGIASFEGTGISSVTIPSNCQNIGNFAFWHCYSLYDVNIANGVSTIGNYAFSYCSNLSSITIPTSVTSIGDCAFENCTALKNISLPPKITKISNFMFACCSILSEITIPSSVVAIGSDAFASCRALKKVSIPSSVESIGLAAFANCAMNSITIPASVQSIDADAFVGCNLLKDIYCGAKSKPSGWKVDLSKYAVHWDSNTSDPENAIRGYCGANGNNVAWEFDRGTGKLSLTGSGDMADFESKKAPWYEYKLLIEAVSIFEQITGIGDNAFSGLVNVSSIVLPPMVTRIGKYAFSDCKFKHIDLPESILSIGEGAFFRCVFEEITLPPKIQKIETYTFANTNLRIIEIPAGVSEIGERVFQECNNLCRVIIPSDSKLTVIGDYACLYSQALYEFNFPKSTERIGNSAFAGTLLENLSLSENTYYIGSSAFSGSFLKTVEIPKSVSFIGEHAFAGCNQLRHIYCEAEEQPEDWDWFWNKNCNAQIHWGHIHSHPSSISCTDGYTCPECKTVIAAKGHTPGEWKTVKEAGIGIEGLKEQRCVECNALLSSKVIPALRQEVITGDISGDNVVNAKDYALLKRYCLGTFEIDESVISAGDINEDGSVNTKDYALLKRACLGTYTIKKRN